MNKKGVVIFFLLFSMTYFCSSGSADTYTNSSLTVSVNISQPTAMIEIFPNNINLGETTAGYETISKNITIKNVGDLDLKLSPILEENADKIFDYLEFATDDDCSTWHNVTYYRSHNLTSSTLNPPTTYRGGDGDQYNSCIKLDLTDYPDTITSGLNLSTNLILWVMPA